MKFRYHGKYEWTFMYLREGAEWDGQEHFDPDDEDGPIGEGIVFSDTISDAVAQVEKDLPSGTTLIMVGRTREIPDEKMEFDVDNPNLEKALKEAKDKTIN